jgi:phosphatidylserine/phosphatidylglycerophosphate/cardiolipin synthase-like enzyme
MRRLWLGISLAGLLLGYQQQINSTGRPQTIPQSAPPIEVHFSPGGGCTEPVVRELNAANGNVYAQAYSFTSASIAKAIVDAHKRGLKVAVILDKSQRTEKYSSTDFVQHAGIPISIDAKHAIAHNKIMILDRSVVITGSFNFTKAAEENNAENLLVIRDRPLAEKYLANWKAHAEHSEPYAGRENGYFETQQPTGEAEPVAPSATPVSGGYVASKTSEVFHRADCKSAAKIS